MLGQRARTRRQVAPGSPIDRNGAEHWIGLEIWVGFAPIGKFYDLCRRNGNVAARRKQ